jgi:hypothetical protein
MPAMPYHAGTVPYQAYDVLLSRYHGDRLSTCVVTMVQQWLVAFASTVGCVVDGYHYEFRHPL